MQKEGGGWVKLEMYAGMVQLVGLLWTQMARRVRSRKTGTKRRLGRLT
jgi:hypothetical protein